MYCMDELKKKKLLTKAEAAFYIGICSKSLDNLISRGDLPAVVRIGYGRGRVFINRNKLDDWIDSQTGL